MGQNTLAGGVRRGPRLTANFTVLSNVVVNDDRLSFRARGVLTWLLSKPIDWRTRSDVIAAQSPKEGRDAIRSALNELVELGYLVREKVQNEHGRWSTIQTVYEQPCAQPKPGKPTSGEPDIGQPGTVERTEKPRTETNRTARASTAPLSAPIRNLAAACHRSGLTATFAYLKPDAAAAIEELIAVHGIAPLVTAARSVHRPNDPMRFAHAWLPLWRSLPSPTPARVRTSCGACDEYGWLPDDEYGRAVRCRCRVPVAA